jgi:hypothetical protein
LGMGIGALFVREYAWWDSLHAKLACNDPRLRSKIELNRLTGSSGMGYMGVHRGRVLAGTHGALIHVSGRVGEAWWN